MFVLFASALLSGVFVFGFLKWTGIGGIIACVLLAGFGYLLSIFVYCGVWNMATRGREKENATTLENEKKL